MVRSYVRSSGGHEWYGVTSALANGSKHGRILLPLVSRAGVSLADQSSGLPPRSRRLAELIKFRSTLSGRRIAQHGNRDDG